MLSSIVVPLAINAAATRAAPPLKSGIYNSFPIKGVGPVTCSTFFLL